jgi:hypothetical protein
MFGASIIAGRLKRFEETRNAIRRVPTFRKSGSALKGDGETRLAISPRPPKPQKTPRGAGSGTHLMLACVNDDRGSDQYILQN